MSGPPDVATVTDFVAVAPASVASRGVTSTLTIWPGSPLPARARLNVSVFAGVSFGFSAALPCTSLVQLCVGWNATEVGQICCVPPNGGETYAVGDPAEGNSATARAALNAKCGTKKIGELDVNGNVICATAMGTCGAPANVTCQ